MMMSSVFEEEIHQFIQVILTFNSKGLGEKQNDYCNTTSRRVHWLQKLTEPQLLRTRDLSCSPQHARHLP